MRAFVDSYVLIVLVGLGLYAVVNMPFAIVPVLTALVRYRKSLL